MAWSMCCVMTDSLIFTIIPVSAIIIYSMISDWQRLCCQPNRSQVWKFSFTYIEFDMKILLTNPFVSILEFRHTVGAGNVPGCHKRRAGSESGHRCHQSFSGSVLTLWCLHSVQLRDISQYGGPNMLCRVYRWINMPRWHFAIKLSITIPVPLPQPIGDQHDDVIQWKHFPRYWPFVRGIHRSPVKSPHKGQWRGALKFSLICVWINGWVNNRKAGDLRCHRAHYDVIVMR